MLAAERGFTVLVVRAQRVGEQANVEAGTLEQESEGGATGGSPQGARFPRLRCEAAAYESSNE